MDRMNGQILSRMAEGKLKLVIYSTLLLAKVAYVASLIGNRSFLGKLIPTL